MPPLGKTILVEDDDGVGLFDRARDLEPFGAGRSVEVANHLLDDGSDAQARRMGVERRGFDLRHVENRLYGADQPPAGALYGVERVALAPVADLREVIGDHLVVARDDVQRSADLVTDVRQERGFQTHGLERGVASARQLRLDASAFREVALQLLDEHGALDGDRRDLRHAA
jgi:hypothetical protein